MLVNMLNVFQNITFYCCTLGLIDILLSNYPKCDTLYKDSCFTKMCVYVGSWECSSYNIYVLSKPICIYYIFVNCFKDS